VYRQCVSDKAAAQQKLFEEAMVESMREGLFEEISISELCRMTGLSRKTFYRLYDSKADVLYSMVDRTILEMGSYTPDASVTPGGMHRFFAYWKTKKDLLDALERNRISALIQQQAVGHVLAESPEIVQCFCSENTEHRTEIVTFYLCGLFSLIWGWHKSGFAYSIDEMAELGMSLMMEPPVKHWLPYL
jgi:AcrR family transcriptional regulator